MSDDTAPVPPATPEAPAQDAAAARRAALLSRLGRAMVPAPPVAATAPEPRPPAALLQQRLAAESLLQQFVLVVLPETGWGATETFTHVDAWLARLKELVGTPAQVFALLGTPLEVRGGPVPAVSTPWGLLPLTQPEAAPGSPPGWLGPPIPVTAEPAEPAEGGEQQRPMNETSVATPPDHDGDVRELDQTPV